jgi:hypothetical protein
MTDRKAMQQALEALEVATTPLAKDRQEVLRAQAALRERLAQPEQEPVAWEDVLGAIARGWTHDDNKHKPMDVQLAVAIAKEIQDMVIAQPQREPPQFPTMLRKMWSGAEVQKWINENWEQS